MKERLLKLFNAKSEERNKLIQTAKTTENIEELRSCNDKIEKLNEEMEELRAAIDEIELEERGSHFVPSGESTLDNSASLISISSAMISNSQRGLDIADYEERQAFMDYVLRGKIPEERRDAVSTISDAGASVPVTVVNRIVEKLRTYGNIFSRITITNIKGGVEIPTKSAKPTAQWVTEGKVAEAQKNAVDGKITFSYHKLQIRIAVTLEADTVSLSIFEDNIVDSCYEAMIVAIEDAIINGSGSGQPLGITKDPKVASQKVDVKPSELVKYDKWSKIFAKIPLAKRQGTVLIVNSETYEGDLMGMVDKNGQPIARVNIGLNGEDKQIFKGKEVVMVESSLPSFEACEPNNVFGIIVNLKDYMLNTNLQIALKRYFDEDTDQFITKSTMIADGKLADHQGVILLTKVNEG